MGKAGNMLLAACVWIDPLFSNSIIGNLRILMRGIVVTQIIIDHQKKRHSLKFSNCLEMLYALKPILGDTTVEEWQEWVYRLQQGVD